MINAPLTNDEITSILTETLHGSLPYKTLMRVFATLAEVPEMRKDAERYREMKAATYSHVDGRDLLHELHPNSAHYIDIIVRINGFDLRYEGDWIKKLTWARDGHNHAEHAAMAVQGDGE